VKNVRVQTHSVADKASLSGLRRSIRSDLARAGVDPALTFDCLVAVTEACTQILLGSDGSDEAAITWSIEESAATFSIHQTCGRERCRASHPAGRSRPGPATAEILDGDLPLALMRQLMDRVSVEEGPGGRRTTLTKLF
jgi:anti-sigma regulatory factor (Ser/Thr protein kinase)